MYIAIITSYSYQSYIVFLKNSTYQVANSNSAMKTQFFPHHYQVPDQIQILDNVYPKAHPTLPLKQFSKSHTHIKHKLFKKITKKTYWFIENKRIRVIFPNRLINPIIKRQ